MVLDKRRTSYKEGRAAYLDHKTSNDNPYEKDVEGDNADRYCWYMGWYDAKYEPLHNKLSSPKGTGPRFEVKDLKPKDKEEPKPPEEGDWDQGEYADV